MTGREADDEPGISLTEFESRHPEFGRGTVRRGPVFDGPKEGDIVTTPHGRFRVTSVKNEGLSTQEVTLEPC